MNIIPLLLAAGVSAQAKFGSPQFIQEWNQTFTAKCGSTTNGAIAVLPKYGFPAHPSAAPAEKAAAVGDYVNDEIANHAMRWGHMPLRTFINAGGPGYLPKYNTVLKEAMNEWNRASKGRVGFVVVNDPSEADVTISWIPGSPGAGEAGNTQTAFAMSARGPVITRVHVDIAAIINGKQVSDGEMMKTCLHELGHALGLQHSSSPGDIMYWQSNPRQGYCLGPRDAATLCRWYGISS